MIDKLLRRFVGAASYENGIRTLVFCTLKSQGTDQPIQFFPKSSLPLDYPVVPILSVNKKRKQQIPYEDELEFSFILNYTNQNDESKQARCTIKEYADEDIDFKIYMQDENDFVKTIVSVESMIDNYISDLDHLINIDTLANDYNIFGVSENGLGWNNNPTFANVVVSEVSNIVKFTYTSLLNNVTGGSNAIPLTDYLFKQKGLNENIIERRLISENSFTTTELEKLKKFKINIGIQGNYGAVSVIIQSPKGTYGKIFTTNTTYYNNLISGGVSAQLISAITGDTTNEYEITTAYVSLFDLNYTPVNIIILGIGYVSLPISTTFSINIGKTEYEHYMGNVGDTVDIVGLVGNIARLEGIFSLNLSDVSYNNRIVNLQKYVETCFRGGMKQQLNQYSLNVSKAAPITTLRLYLRLFSTFIAPNAINMQESMNSIIKIIDPLGTVDVYGEFSDSYYKMIVDFFITFTEFDTGDVNLLLEFANRYRPIPADIDVNIVFTNEEEIVPEETATLIVETDPAVMSSFTIMSPTLIMGNPATLVITLPNTYP